MKSIAAVICLFLLCLPLSAAETPAPTEAVPKYPIEEAAAHEGEHVTIEGIVSSVRTSNAGHLYINFGGKFPEHVFAVSVKKRFVADLPPLDDAVGRTMRVTGQVEMYEGKPQIQIKSADQIELLPAETAGEPAKEAR